MTLYTQSRLFANFCLSLERYLRAKFASIKSPSSELIGRNLLLWILCLWWKRPSDRTGQWKPKRRRSWFERVLVLITPCHWLGQRVSIGLRAKFKTKDPQWVGEGGGGEWGGFRFKSSQTPSIIFFPATLSFKGHTISFTSPSQQKFAWRTDILRNGSIGCPC